MGLLAPKLLLTQLRKEIFLRKEERVTALDITIVNNEDMKDPAIYDSFLRAYNERVIDAGHLSRNKDIKTNCKTTKPQRGTFRIFKDSYLFLSVTDPYDRNKFLHCNIHRLAAFLFLEEELIGKLRSLHKCDIKMCCNPDHLYIGTDRQNRIDTNNRRTDQGPNRRPTRYEWESINYWKNIGEHTLDELADYFNLHKSTVQRGGTFTTDGSEVIGEVFVPRMIPEAAKITRFKQKILIGSKLLDELSKFKKIDEECGSSWLDIMLKQKSMELGLEQRTVIRYMRVAKANPTRENFNYGITQLDKMIQNGIDISVSLH
jgi:hypothetical protein